MKLVLKKATWMGVLLLGCALQQAQAVTQYRPALSGYLVNSLLHGPAKTIALHATPQAAADDFCGSAKVTSSYYLGSARYYNATGSGTPGYKVSCLVLPTPGNPPVWQTDITWDIQYVYLCKSRNSLFDERTKTCTVTSDRPPQAPTCKAENSTPIPGQMSSAGHGAGQNEVGNPIDIGTGQKLLRETDYAPVQGLGFTRLYNSADLATNTFAPHWRHNYSRKIISTLDMAGATSLIPTTWVLNPLTSQWLGINTDADPIFGVKGGTGIGLTRPDPLQPVPNRGDTLYLIRDDGHHLFFHSTDRGLTWATDSGVNYRIQGTHRDTSGRATQWQVTTPETDIEIYDAASGQLQSIQFRDGRRQTLGYSTSQTLPELAQRPGMLLEVSDNFGRALRFRYHNNLLASMIDPAGQEFIYEYDDFQRLVAVTWPDGLKRRYHYDEPELSTSNAPIGVNGYLTGISDEVAKENWLRMATYRYDQNGTPLASEHANAANRYVVNSANRSVTDPLGTVRQYQFIQKDGMQLLSSVSKPGGAGCAASSSSLNYDSELNLISQTDFNGTVTRFDYYPQNLLKTRTDAFGTPQQRSSHWQWHPVFRLPSKIAQPKLLTTNEYDARGNLLSTTEQATLDETGAQGLNPTPSGPSRKISYRYNGVSQVTEQTEWRDDRTLTTVYEYHPENGNLEKMTDPTGLITRYTDYDAHGAPTRIEQPNNDLIRLEYFPRRWLNRRTEIRQDNTSETTTWEYDGRGLLTRLTSPNGDYYIYNYDDAQRLTNIADNFANSLDYTLDPMGNRLLEQVRDPVGNLLHQIRRSYDALNRLQQVTVGQNDAAQDTPSNTVIESAAPLARAGFPVKITVMVNGAAPGGEVVLMQGERTVGIQFLQRGSTTFTVSNLSLGRHVLSAFYSGDEKNRPSRSPQIEQTIQPAIANQITLDCPANSVIEGALVCQAKIRTDSAWANRLPGQTLRLFDSNIELASATLTGMSDDPSTSQAEFTVRGLGLGQHTMQVRYDGDAIILPGQSTEFAHTVQDHAPQISEITFSGQLIPGLQYDLVVSRGERYPVVIGFSYVIPDTIPSYEELAQRMADGLRASNYSQYYQIEVIGSKIRITGKNQQSYHAGIQIIHYPSLYSYISQEALSPRPARRGKFSFKVVRHGPQDEDPFSVYISVERFIGTRRHITRGTSMSYDLPKKVTPSYGPRIAHELCQKLDQLYYPEIWCSKDDAGEDQYVIQTPPGEQRWLFLSNVYTAGKPVYEVLGGFSSAPQAEVTEPQPQIIEVSNLSLVFPGVTYTITAGDESWQYTAGPTETTPLAVFQGLLTQIHSSQYVGQIVFDEDIGYPKLQIKSTTPLQPFAFSTRVSNVPFAAESRILQAAR